MTLLTYYHSTTKERWDEFISHQGLIPQPLNRIRMEAEGMTPFFDEAGIPLRALALWPEGVISKPLVEDFFLWQTCKNNTRTSIVLECKAPREGTLSWKVSAHRKNGDSITVSHHQTIGADGAAGTTRPFMTHNNVPLEWYVEPIPLENIRPIFEISIAIKKVSRFTKAKLPPKPVNYDAVYREFSNQHVAWANELNEDKK